MKPKTPEPTRDLCQRVNLSLPTSLLTALESERTRIEQREGLSVPLSAVAARALRLGLQAAS